ncbi:unnamed protein product [Mytilus coruscus]|uniref:Uncharacterized protein n=1 Tax=Mytilus coruscus TaxID=42192 RepID=A0A6J8B5V9_MYTCO|nr:unnamed protein product [Mytilus coruscus]
MTKVYTVPQGNAFYMCGDWNSRCSDFTDSITGIDNLPDRHVVDFQCNSYGKVFCEFLTDVSCCILNGRNTILNDYTYVSTRGLSVVDYCVVPYEMLDIFNKFKVTRTSVQMRSLTLDGFTWLKKTNANPLRGIADDGKEVAETNRRTTAQKCTHLDFMLGQNANYCPIISRNTIIKNSTSINSIWQSIRLHYGFQSTGGHFLDFNSIFLEPNERPEDLFHGNIHHHGEVPEADEELSPSLENLIVLTWLRLIHRDLPNLVKQRYGTELRSKTLASLKPEILQALDSLLDEIYSSTDAKVLRASIKDKHFDRSAKDVRLVSTKQSLYFKAFYKHFPIELSLDTGAEVSMIKASSADYIGVTIKKSSHSALQDDGVTPLNIVGECHFTLSRDVIELQLEALVVNDLDVDILAVCRRQNTHREYTSVRQFIQRNEHFCRVRLTTTVDNAPEAPDNIRDLKKTNYIDTTHTSHFSNQVSVDPDNLLSPDLKTQFNELLRKFSKVFSRNFEGYNGAIGPFEASVNMGPVQPPQRKGRMPQYSKNNLVELQNKFDELEWKGVFRKPEDVGISVEYINPSFLVKKASGGFRLVTTFAEVGRYSKPQPSLMPDVDSTHRTIAQWK